MTVVAPSQRIIIVFLLNSKGVYSVLNDLLIERQGSATLTYRAENTYEESTEQTKQNIKSKPIEPSVPEADAEKKTTSITPNKQEIIAKEESAKRAPAQTDEIARRDAEAWANTQTQPKTTSIPPQQTLSDKLTFALKYQSTTGMINYLKNIADDRVKEILNGPAEDVREKIQALLDNMK